MLSFLLVGDALSANIIVTLADPLTTLNGIDLKGIDTVKWVLLHTLLTQQTFDDLLLLHEPQYAASEDGAWVTVLPNELVNALADLSNEQRDLLGKRWASLEEFTRSGWTLAEVATTLHDICELAKTARSGGEALLLWQSL
jgi:hypothetical protein